MRLEARHTRQSGFARLKFLRICFVFPRNTRYASRAPNFPTNYIKKHNLQDPANRRNINADAKLRPLFGKDQVSMFELTKLVSQHLK